MLFSSEVGMSHVINTVTCFPDHMRALWTGSLSFGLVSIPVKLYPAAQSHGLDFDFLHRKDHEPIRYARICSVDGREVPYADIVRGYEVGKGEYVIVNDEDFKHANARKTKIIDLKSFADESDIDTIYYQKPYFLEPEKGGEKPYALMREALKKSGKVGIATFVLRNREHLAAIRPSGNALILHQLRFSQDMRDTADFDFPVSHVYAKEMDIALALIEQLSAPFQAEDYKDTYTQEMLRIINQKRRGIRPKLKKAEEPLPTKVADLMELLKASLEQERKEHRHLTGAKSS